MEQQARAVDISVGLFILLGLGSVLFLLLQTTKLGGYAPGDGYELKARFENVGDLKVRAPVSLAGVTIGRVTEITVDPVELRAVVKLRIDSQFDQIPADTDASIMTAGLLGGKYIELQPGGADTFLKDQDEIELTQSAILLENLIGKYMLNQTSGKRE